MARSGFPDGAPCWPELVTPDVDAAVTYYGELFGWSTTDEIDAACRHREFLMAGKPVAGLTKASGSQPAQWLVHFAVRDLAGATDRLQRAGGTVEHGPIDAGRHGSLAICLDPQRVRFVLHQVGERGGVEPVGAIGTWMWSELMTREVEAEKAFYRRLFGWPFGPGPKPDYHPFFVDENEVGAIMATPPQVPAEIPDMWTPYFVSGDLEASLELTQYRDGTVVWGPETMPGAGTFVEIVDAQGAAFYLVGE